MGLLSSLRRVIKKFEQTYDIILCGPTIDYQDVHNLLALPKGAIIPYTYRQTLLSDEARIAASTSTFVPQQVLHCREVKCYTLANPRSKSDDKGPLKIASEKSLEL